MLWSIFLFIVTHAAAFGDLLLLGVLGVFGVLAVLLVFPPFPAGVGAKVGAVVKHSEH